MDERTDGTTDLSLTTTTVDVGDLQLEDLDRVLETLRLGLQNMVVDKMRIRSVSGHQRDVGLSVDPVVQQVAFEATGRREDLPDVEMLELSLCVGCGGGPLCLGRGRRGGCRELEEGGIEGGELDAKDKIAVRSHKH